MYKDDDLNYPIVEERKWDRNSFHYDNVAKAMLTLFVVSTFEGWPGYDKTLAEILYIYVSFVLLKDNIPTPHRYKISASFEIYFNLNFVRTMVSFVQSKTKHQKRTETKIQLVK